MKKLNRVLLVSSMAISLMLIVVLTISGTARARENEEVVVSSIGKDTHQADNRKPSHDGPFLTGPNEGDPLEIALVYIEENKDHLGLTASDLAEMVVNYQYTSKHNGVTHIYLDQQWQGIQVYNGIININITADGRVVNVGNRFVSNLGEAVNTHVPTLSAVAAVETAADHLGLDITEALVVEENIGGATQAVVLNDGGISLEKIPAKLIYQFQDDVAHLAWDITIYELDAQHWWSLRVDATTGEVLDQQDLVVHEDFLAQAEAAGHGGGAVAHTPAAAQNLIANEDTLAPDDYFVYPWPIESPNHTSPAPPADARTLVTDPATSASPFGWHDTDGNPGHESQFTVGNNVDAYEDTNNTNSPTGGDAARADGGPTLFFSHTIDLTLAPINYVDAAVTNLFYWNNTIHDMMHVYGFDEPAGNFQENNYGNGGLGSDSVNAEAQDGGGNCNANFATPTDGNNPRMQMYTCTNSSPAHDGDLDNAVIVHEYGHGISNRLTGGPSTTSCLNNSEQMGEGWSDWYALMMTMEAGDTGPDARGIGTYLFGQPPNGPGIRPAPYSTDFGVNGFTYGDIPGQAIPHGVGFVWATALWEMTWELINLYGLDPDIFNGTGGNNLALQLVTDGMKLQPCSPGFVDGRDAILQADAILTGGANECILWDAFARRGLGFSADQGSSGSTGDGTEAFDLPPQCLLILSINKFASPPVVAPGDTITYTLVVNNNTTSTLTSVVISDVVPAGTTYVPGSASDGGSESGGVVTWPAITLNSGDTATRTFQVDVFTSTSPIFNEACVAAAEGDNACGSVNTQVLPPAPFPTCLDFESGSLPSSMFAETTSNGAANGRVAVTTAFPQTGSFGLDLDTDCDNCGGATQQAAILVINLAGQSNVSLNFWVFEHFDENNPEDGVFVSDDGGTTWALIQSLNNFPASYQAVSLDLDAAVAGVGMSYVDGFMIRFQSLDGATIPGNDGYSFDNICVQGSAPNINVSPSSLSSSQLENELMTQTLSINNTGTLTLNWTISETPALEGPLVIPTTGSNADNPNTLTNFAAEGRSLVNEGSAAPSESAAGAAPTGITYYGDRVTFDGDNPGLPIEDFEEGNVAAGGVLGCDAPLDSTTTGGTCFAVGDIEPGIRFQDDVGPDAGGLVIVGDGFNGNPDISLLANTFVDSFDMFFDPPVFAAGMDLQSHFNPDTVNITIYEADGTTVMATTTAAATNAGSFWGVTSATPIGRIKVDSPTDQAEGVDNVAFGGTAAGGCGTGDIPWATVSPTAGSTAPGGSTPVQVVFDSTGLTPNTTYTGTLCIDSNDPDTPVLEVPLTLNVVGAASFPVCADFETGTLPPFMLAETTSNGAANGRVAVTTNNPFSGLYAMDIDTDCDGCGGNTQQAGVLIVDLAGVTEAELNFWGIEFGDENNPEDGIFISDDGGTTYAQIFSLNNFPATYTNVVIDLVAAASGAGMSLVDGFRIKFQSLDNFSIPTDGYAFDNICVQQAQPDIVTSPSSFSDVLFENEMVTMTLNIGNLGSTDLDWDIDEAPTDCASPGAVPWVSANPISGTTPSLGSDTVDVIFDSTGLAHSNSYTATLCVNSNDPDTPQITIPLSLTVLAAPEIVVTPASLSSVQTGNTQITQTLTISNVGSGDLIWDIEEEAFANFNSTVGADARQVSAWDNSDGTAYEDVSTAAATENTIISSENVPLWQPTGTVIYDNGPLVNSPGTGVGGADESVLQNVSLGMNIFGFGHQVSAGNRVADDFTIPPGETWTIDTITFFGYQTGSSTTSTITEVNLRIWDGEPGNGGTVIWGDTSTNVLVSTAWANIYRVLETTTGTATDRPVMANVTDIGGLVLPAGDYWLDWQTGGTLASGPWAPAVTINGQTTTGNGIQSLTDNGATWAPAIDVGQQGFPFVIEGGSGCAATNIPWVSAAPTSGTTPSGGADQVAVTFDSTGLAPGVYTGTLCINSNDAVGNATVRVPLDLTVIFTGSYGVDLSSDMAMSGTVGTTVTYTLSVFNFGSSDDTYDITVGGNSWTTTPSVSSITVPSGATSTFDVWVDVPAGAQNGDMDTASITATSQGDPGVSDSVTLTTTAIGPTEPVIDVDPSSLESIQAPDAQIMQTLTIANVGGGTLNWTISETTSIPTSLLVVPTTGSNADNPDTLTNYVSEGLSLVSSDGAAQSESTAGFSPDGITYYADRGVFDGDNPGLPIEDFEEGNVAAGGVLGCDAPLDATTTGGTCFAVGDIEPGILFQDDVGPDAGGLVILGDGFDGNPDISLLANTFVDSFDIFFDPPVLAAGMDLQSHFNPDTVDITIYEADGTTVMATTTAAATNAGSFWGVTAPAPIGRIKVDSPTDQAEGVDNIAFGGSGGGGGGCTNGDIPWLSVSPNSGSTAGGAADDVTVTFDSTGIANGTYTGTLCISSNDVGNPTVNVPVTMTVVTPTYGVEIEADSAMSGDPGSTVTYMLWVTNTGTVADVISLAVSGNTWTTTLSDSSVTLNPGQGTSVTASVDIPAGAAAGATDMATVTATSGGDPGESDSVALTTTANAVYGVDLSGDMAMTGTVGTTVTYMVWVTNTGNTADTINLAVSGNSWTTTLSASSVSLAAGASTAVSVSVDVPGGAAGGDMDVATVTATSAGDPSQSDAADLTTTAVAGVVYGVELSADMAMSGTVGTTVVYTVWVTNTGNMADTFDLTVSGNSWTTTLSASSVSLAAGASTSVSVSVDIPAGAADGATDTATVTATSSDGTTSDSTDLTTTAINPSAPGPMIYLPFVVTAP